tara:strand:+ start:1751 stop:1987 length:237 start_codon:yes stop_codon:yes gene_type:complete
MLTKKFVRLNIVNISILLFLVLFSIIHYLKPGFIYNKEGGFRPFGVGYKHKTVVPMWLIAVFLAILCYMFVLVYVLNM